MSPVVKKDQREQARKKHLEREMSGRSPLERWWGVEGITHLLGHPRFMTDRGLEGLARRFRRGLEDVHDGLAHRAEPDLSNEQTEANLREIKRWQGAREALRHTWLASEDGTESHDGFCQAGGLAMLAEASKTGQEPLIRPDYKLAAFMDWRRWLEGRLTALDWSDNAPKGCYESTWAREAWREERAAYYAWSEQS